MYPPDNRGCTLAVLLLHRGVLSCLVDHATRRHGMDTQPRHRPPRRFVDATRLVMPYDRVTCLQCGQPLALRKTWYVKKSVQTRDGPIFVAGKRNRCGNPACPHPGATYYAS